MAAFPHLLARCVPGGFPGIIIGAQLGLAWAAAVPPLEFRTAPAFPVGGGPWQIAVGHINADAYPDLATANFGDSTVSVLLGRPDGAFEPAAHFRVGWHPDSLALADFNGDHAMDIVTANANGWDQPGTVSLLLGHGDGTFGTASNVTVGAGPRGVAVADYNGDNFLDVATAISGGWSDDNQVAVLLGRGDGTFDAPLTFTVGIEPAWVATGDFNRDQRPDLVTVDAGPGPGGTTATVLTNAGAGAFAWAATVTIGSYPGFVLVADFNHDDNLDFVASARGDALVSVVLGRGDGTLEPAQQIEVPAGASQLASGRFNADAHLDLAVLGGTYDSGVVSLLPGTGTGGFEPPIEYSIGAGLQAIVAGELDENQGTDLAVAGGYDSAVLLMAGRGDGSFEHTTDACAVNGEIQRLITADLNHDGRLDLASVSRQNNSVSVLLQESNGVFRPAASYVVGAQPHALKAGDFDNDGRVDLVTADFFGTVTFLRGSDSNPGSFTTDWGQLELAGSHTDIAVGDFNADTFLDFVTVDYYGRSIIIGFGNGSGGILTTSVIGVNFGPSCLLVEDFDGNGAADIVVGYDGGSVVSLLLGNADGNFQPARDVPSLSIPWFIASGDFDFDGRPDLVAANYDWQRVAVMMNQGGGSFASPIPHAVANEPVTVAVADFNGDNFADIVSGNYASVSVLLGNGDGTFLTATNYFVGGMNVAAGDLNQDGMPDLAIDLVGKVGLFWNDTLPRLQISQAAAGMRLAWPAWPFYSLETSTNLAHADSWMRVTDPPAHYGNQFVLTNELSAANQSFRLKRPGRN